MATDTQGFTVTELLIIVAIILVISAIAIPHLMKSKQAARQAAAVASLRTITAAEVLYASTYTHEFSPSLRALDGVGVIDVLHH